MKKMLSLLASMCVALSAVSATASAQEYEKYPSMSDFATIDEFHKALSDGIKDGRYFADFDGNGMFDPIDAFVLCIYYSNLSCSIPADEVDWNGRNHTFSFAEEFWGGFLHNYDTFDLNGETAVTIELNNEMLENVKKYGDISGEGEISSKDASHFIAAYYNGFETGDVNTDNEVNASDASYVLKYYSNKSTGQPVDSYTEQSMLTLGDVNGDGIIDANDATLILSAYSELSVAE